MDRVKRLKRCGRADQAAIMQASNADKKDSRAAQKQSWEEFLDNAKGENMWSVAQYTKPNRVTTSPNDPGQLRQRHDTHDKKAAMLAELAFHGVVRRGAYLGRQDPRLTVLTGHQRNGTVDVGCSPVNSLGALINECPYAGRVLAKLQTSTLRAESPVSP